MAIHGADLARKNSEISRRAFVGGTAGAALGAAAALAPTPAWAQSFSDFVASLRPLARAGGVTDATFDSVAATLTPDPEVERQAASQPEFEISISDYLRRAVSASRIAHGRAIEKQWSDVLEAVERDSGAPAEIVLAAWGMEADFSRPAQTRDTLGAIATLAWLRPQDQTYRTEFVAALKILDQGLAPRARLVGSWAGAMGMPQFMPSAYLKYAVRRSGPGAPDIWTSTPDALASIANFFARSGWDKALPWGLEAKIPSDFDWTSLTESFQDWRKLGLTAVDGRAWPERGEGALFAPEGANGPVWLLTSNFQVIKKYDNSDSYALALGLLGDALTGRSGPRKPWPAEFRPLPKDDRVRLQKGLATLQLYDGPTDGKIGPVTREAVHRFQRAAGLKPADGLASSSVLAALDARLGSR